MGNINQKLISLERRKHRVRTMISGSQTRPRLSVKVSHKHVSAQLIDDTTHRTVAYASTSGQKISRVNLTEKASWVGTEIAKKAKAARIKKVVFDRNGMLYHGRIKALADAARTEGLEF